MFIIFYPGILHQLESYSVKINVFQHHCLFSYMCVFFRLYHQLFMGWRRALLCWAFPWSLGVFKVLPDFNMSMTFGLVYACHTWEMTWLDHTTTASEGGGTFLTYLVPFLYFQLYYIDFYLLWTSFLRIWHLKLELIPTQHTVINHALTVQWC